MKVLSIFILRHAGLISDLPQNPKSLFLTGNKICTVLADGCLWKFTENVGPVFICMWKSSHVCRVCRALSLSGQLITASSGEQWGKFIRKYHIITRFSVMCLHVIFLGYGNSFHLYSLTRILVICKDFFAPFTDVYNEI